MNRITKFQKSSITVLFAVGVSEVERDVANQALLATAAHAVRAEGTLQVIVVALLEDALVTGGTRGHLVAQLGILLNQANHCHLDLKYIRK